MSTTVGDQTMPRYAVYAAPGFGQAAAPDLLLREKAESWLGRSVTTRAVPRACPDGWTRQDVDDLTADARRYGYHGTLKAPFRLAAGYSVEDLTRATAQIAATSARVVLPTLALTRLGDFFALTPGEQTPELCALGSDVVIRLEEFRAPLTAAETARRHPDLLTSRQRRLLDRFGYPYVLEEFRFHLTLTDPVGPERRTDVEAVLLRWFSTCLGRPATLDALTIFEEPEPGAPFRLHSVHPLEGHR